jgi:hypothetical protein
MKYLFQYYCKHCSVVWMYFYVHTVFNSNTPLIFFHIAEIWAYVYDSRVK